jgi:hypothetical protein
MRCAFAATLNLLVTPRQAQRHDERALLLLGAAIAAPGRPASLCILAICVPAGAVHCYFRLTMTDRMAYTPRMLPIGDLATQVSVFTVKHLVAGS